MSGLMTGAQLMNVIPTDIGICDPGIRSPAAALVIGRYLAALPLKQ